MKYLVKIFRVSEKFEIEVNNVETAAKALDIASDMVNKGRADKFKKEIDQELIGIAKEIE